MLMCGVMFCVLHVSVVVVLYACFTVSTLTNHLVTVLSASYAGTAVNVGAGLEGMAKSLEVFRYEACTLKLKRITYQDQRPVGLNTSTMSVIIVLNKI